MAMVYRFLTTFGSWLMKGLSEPAHNNDDYTVASTVHPRLAY